MNGVAEKNAYRKEQFQMTNKHLNKQWDHEPHLPKTKGVKTPYQDVLDKKWDTAKKKLKPPVDMEAILALEEKLWNS
jgi:hypothetical protein